MTDHKEPKEQIREQADERSTHLTVKNGQVYVIREGVATPVPFSTTVESGDLVVANPSAHYVVIKNGVPTMVNEPCATCIRVEGEGVEVIGLSGNIGLSQSDAALTLLEDDITALQRAILEGIDPTEELEPPAAGGVVSSSIGGYSIVHYDYTAVLAKAGFETSYIRKPFAQLNEDDAPLIPALGGGDLSITVREGDLSDPRQGESYPVSGSKTLTVSAGTLGLDVSSFVFDTLTAATVVAELSNETFTSGKSISYALSDDGREIIGTSDRETVVTIVLTPSAAGRDVELTTTVTIYEPIDHLPSDTSGLVRVVNDALEIDLSVKGADNGGTALREPIDVTITITDGALPTIEPASISHSENDLGFVSKPIPLNIEANSDEISTVAFTSTSELRAVLDGLTSNGEATTYEISNDVITVSLASDPSSKVFSIQLESDNGDYNYVFSENASVDQANGESVLIPVTVAVTDFDNDTIEGRFSVTITDGDNANGSAATESGSFDVTEARIENGTVPKQTAEGEIAVNAGSDRLEPDSLSIANLTESGGVPGLLDELNELTSNGQALTFTVSPNSSDGTITIEGKLPDDPVAVSITLVATQASGSGATGVSISSTFELSQPLDHVDDAKFAGNRWVTRSEQSNNAVFDIELQVQLKDSDGDALERPISVKYQVTDGESPTIQTPNIDVTDPDANAQAVVETSTLGLVLGSDEIASLVWNIGSGFQSFVESLSSDGNALSIIPSNAQITGSSDPINIGYQDGSGVTVTVLTFTLLPSSGEYKVTLNDAIDQPNSEDVVFNLGVKVTDYDGDSASSTFEVKVLDGKDLSLNPVDADLTDPNVGDINEQENLSLGLTLGADALKSVVFYAPTGLEAALNAITSSGYDTSVQPQPFSSLSDTISIVIDDANSPNNGETALSITLNKDANGLPDGTYTVKQFFAIDEPSDVISLPIGVRATDTDGDTVSNEFTVTIRDSDASGASQASGTAEITEPDLTPGTGEQGYPDSANTAIEIKTQNDRLIPDSAGLESAQVANVLNNLNGVLTSNGTAVVFTYNATTRTLTGSADNEAVLTVTFPAVQASNGADAIVSPTITLLKPLDHDANGTSNANISVNGEQISILLPLQVKDSDGDAVTGGASVDLIIKDGAGPSITTTPALNVEESDINQNGSGANSNRPGTTPGGVGTDQDTDSGKLVIDKGSDSINDIALDVSAFASNNSANSQNSSGVNVPLSSKGEPVTLVLASDSNGIKTYKGMAETREVFSITLDSQGNYTFTLLGALDHPRGDEKNTLTINLPVVVTDSDNDTATSILNVNVTDDVPFSLETDGVGVGGGALVTEEGDHSPRLTVMPARNRGADDSHITSVTINGEKHELNVGLNNTFTVTEGVGGQVLGTLLIQSSGNVQFTAAEDVDHSGSTNNRIVETFSYEILDGDGDIVVGSTQIVVVDSNPQLVVENATGVEDQGREGDPNDDLVDNPADGIPINMSVNVGDDDEGETVDRVLITLPANAQGTFYANGTELAVTDGKITLPSNLFTPDAQNEIWTLQGVTFVPDQDYSASSGIPTFTVTGFVKNTDGSERALPTQTFTITVEGIADVPQWDSENTTLYYNIDEDSEGANLAIEADLQDSDGSETLTYFLTLESGEATLLLNGNELTPSGGKYEVAAADINNVVVKPNANYSGDITLTVVAQSKETSNFVAGQQTADSAPRTITIAVNPEADATTLKVARVSGDEDTLIPLGNSIELTNTVDTDSSETLYVWISGLPEGANLFMGTDKLVADNNGLYEVLYSDIANLKLDPPPESNVDFAISVRGVVKDTAIITNASGVDQTVTQVYETNAKTLNVALKGVADEPDIEPDLGDIWQPVIEGGQETGIETTIEEDSSVSLSFQIKSGEDGDKLPGDNSETLTTLLTKIPEGVTLLDTNNQKVNLVYAGLDDETPPQPQYQASINGLSDIKLIPPEGSTKDITMTVSIVVTENDGDSLTVNRDVIIHIEPKIDATNYALSSLGYEDQPIDINWRPDEDSGFTDNREEIVGIVFSMSSTAIAAGYELTIEGESSPLAFSNGEVVLSSAQVTALVNGAALTMKAPLNSDVDEDIGLSVKLTVEQKDEDDPSIVDRVDITGDLNVRIVATVEEGDIEVVNSANTAITAISDGGTGSISLSESDHRLVFKTAEGINTDGSSQELITEVVISFVQNAQGDPFTGENQAYFDQFYIKGGINNGDGSWTIPESSLADLTISTSSPISTPVFVKIVGTVQDQGDAGEGDKSAEEEQAPIVITLDFSGHNTNTQEAGDITVNTGDITGVEDTTLNLGQQLDGLISIDPTNAPDDELTLVINAAVLSSAGVTVSGMEFNSVTAEYVAKVNVAADGSVDLSGVSLSLPKHFAGDFTLPIKLVTTDQESGDTKEITTTIDVLIAPQVDGVETSVTVIQTNGLDSEKQPDPNSTTVFSGEALEDGIIKLSITDELLDLDTDPTKGVENITSVELSVEGGTGQFVDASGQVVEDQNGVYTVSVAQLSEIYFKPTENYSGPVSVNIKTFITDTAQNDDTGNPDSSVSGSVESSVSFTVLPVNDPITFSGNANPISGDEDSHIALTGISANVQDTDGSEEIVSIQITGVPDDFQLVSTGSQLVQNSGNGVWTINVPSGSQSVNLDHIAFVPPENFSGSLTVDFVVYAKEKNLDVPKEYESSINVVVNPVGDGVDTDITTAVSGTEDEQIVLPLDISVIDNGPSYDGTGLAVTENGPEQVRVVLTNVPASSTLSLPTNAPAGSTIEKQPDGSWIANINGQTLSELIFTPGDANENNWDGKLEISVRAVDNGVEAVSSLWDDQTITVTVSAVNDAPELTLPSTPLAAEEESALLIESIQVKDVDASESPSGEIEVRLSVKDGVIGLPLGAPTTGITVTGAGSETLILEGPLDAINTLLAAGVTYTGDTNFSGADLLTVTVDDNGNTGSGGAKTDAESVAINVAPKPDIPSLTLSNAQTAAVGGSIAALIPLLGLAAALTDPSETLSVEIRDIPSSLTFVDSDGVTIGTGPVAGTLTLTATELAQLHVMSSSPVTATVSVVAISTTSLNEDAESTPISLSINVQDPAQQAIHAQDTSVENVVVSGNEGATLEGGDGDDSLIGGLGADILIGGSGNDELFGGQDGADVVKDTFVWSTGDLGSVGSPAVDTIKDFELAHDVLDLSQAVSVSNLATFSDLTTQLSLSEKSGNAQLNILTSGDTVQEIILPGISLDALVNGDASNLSQSEQIAAIVNSGVLHLGDNIGTEENDSLVAESGGESLFGMNGNDTLQAGNGNDILTGGEGDDIFLWLESSLSTPKNSDTVTDFELGQDKIDITDLLPDLGASPTASDLLPYFDDAEVDGNGTITLQILSGSNEQTIVMENMDVSSSGLDLAAGAQTSEIINALFDQQAFKLD
ncbi:retention module-containing protein [Enterovibrio sp. ZSDZ35]|uniref:Retention module-containing protein n=1 Tax=Enterovibrio qingdaonensis TaxID=2899818 RepID=A0ABT5QIP0_9GAMM|nr:retention module-containing protein [Enterovibrio sp. ZSDZ35]MDD1780850.1 retention module-containing protein [Enterovibrio sp. ZSDZ35]